jgi:septum formation protein
MFSAISSDWNFILASRSPRRQQLLRELGLDFEVVIKEYDENYPQGLSGSAIAEYLSLKKATHFRDDLSDRDIVITSDTVVWCDNQILDKPTGPEDAIRILKILSGKTHEVITGVTFLSGKGEYTFSDTTKVTFDNLTNEEIKYYVHEFEPYDKAGGYGIQEWIGLTGIISIEGSYFNVVGLPVQKLYRELIKFIEYISKRD